MGATERHSRDALQMETKRTVLKVLSEPLEENETEELKGYLGGRQQRQADIRDNIGD